MRENRNRSLLRGGTITRTVRDPRGLALSVWVGTNDTGATDNDPTGGGAAGNNMVAVQTSQYRAFAHPSMWLQASSAAHTRRERARARGEYGFMAMREN